MPTALEAPAAAPLDVGFKFRIQGLGIIEVSGYWDAGLQGFRGFKRFGENPRCAGLRVEGSIGGFEAIGGSRLRQEDVGNPRPQVWDAITII